MTELHEKPGYGIKRYDIMPDGWKVIKGATNAPTGYVWISNGKSLFGGEYKHGLLKCGTTTERDK